MKYGRIVDCRDKNMLLEPEYPSTLVISAGNPMEAHGPALPGNFDSVIATRAAIEAVGEAGGVYTVNMNKSLNYAYLASYPFRDEQGNVVSDLVWTGTLADGGCIGNSWSDDSD